MDKNLLQRSLSGLLYGALIICCTTPLASIFLPQGALIKPFHLYYGLMTLLLLVGLYEGVRVMKFSQGWLRMIVVPVVLTIYFLFSRRYFTGGFNYQPDLTDILSISLVGVAAATILFFTSELNSEFNKVVLLVLYLALPFGYALGLPSFGPDIALTLEAFMLFLLIWSSDSFAFFTGKFFGKHKMAPAISPNKTWEGFAGGAILTLAMGYLINLNFPDLRGNWIIVGALVALFAPLGDLIESKLKRHFEVKDSGNIIPGHGGILDRLDSFIICAPIVYLYFIIDYILVLK